MSQQRQTVTDRLADVIEVVQLGRKSGLLTVERGEGASLEEGAITFVNGQPVQARLGSHSGAEALQRLSRWGSCRFAFTPLPAGTAHGQGPPMPPAGPSSLAPLPQGGQERLRPPGAAQGSRPAGQRPGSDSQPLPPRSAARATLPLPQQRSPAPVSAEGTPGPGGSWSARIPGRALPYALALQRMERLGLSRAHRRLFLLIDGSRLPAELARLMGRSEEEIRRLLSDLERTGFIVSQ